MNMAWTTPWLESLIKKITYKKNQTDKNKNFIKFEALTPSNTIDDKTSFEALDFALSQDNIHNIAITGNYGSGKSSIINTYFKNRKDCLRISLATFALNDLKIDKNGNQIDLDQLPKTTIQAIEKSILQQILYKKSGNFFPFSRFNRIKNYSILKISIIELFVILIGALSLKIIKTSWWTHYINCLSFQFSLKSFILSILSTIAGIFSLYFIIRFCCRLKINKLSFIKTEVGLGEINNESLLNKYIDELLYFFEITSFNIIIFEDLDRFQNSEIFIKLRELNTIINNYEKIKSKIIFIYALRDEVFTDSSRTKFFDFIIPVIPIINSQNSSDILLRKQKENPNTALSNVQTAFLLDVGLYIEDMRLLTNCINEFRIYDEKINESYYQQKTTEKQDQTKIFALIIYKNLYPKDFSELTLNKGILFSIFQEKQKFKIKEIDKINEEIEILEKEYSNLKTYQPFTLNQLRRCYVNAILSENKNYYINTKNLDLFLSDDSFSKIISEQRIILPDLQRGNVSISFNWMDIEKKVDPKYSYAEKERQIKKLTIGRLEEISSEIQNKKDLKLQINLKPLKNLNSLKEIIDEKVPDNSIINKEFIHFLLRKGYIDENYFDYISYFYSESLSFVDKQFLLIIKNNNKPNFSLPITNINNILKRINIEEWDNNGILNNNLLDFVLKTKKQEHLDDFLSTMYIHDQENPQDMFYPQYNNEAKKLSIVDNEVNSFILNDAHNFSMYFENNKELLFRFFININSFNNDYFKKFVKEHPSFLARIISNEEEIIITKKLCEMEIKFNLFKEISQFPIYSIILENCLYEITKENLTFILNKEKNEQKQYPNILTEIANCDNKTLINYVYDDINLLIDKVLKPYKEDIVESDEIVLSILHNDDVLPENILFILEYNQTKILDINKFDKQILYTVNNEHKKINVWDLLFQYNKVSPLWENVFAYYNELDNISKILSNYLQENITQLHKEKIISEEDKNNKESKRYKECSSFFSNILGCNEIEINVYKELLTISPWLYDNISNYDLDDEHLTALVSSGILTLSKNNYLGIRNKNLEAAIKLLGKNFNILLTKEEIPFISEEDIIYLVSTDFITDKQKIELGKNEILPWSSMDNVTLISVITNVILNNKEKSKVLLPIQKMIKVHFEENNKILDIISLLHLQIDNYSLIEWEEAFLILPKPYCEILQKGTTDIHLENTDENKNLSKLLKQKKWISSTYINKNKELCIRRKR